MPLPPLPFRSCACGCKTAFVPTRNDQKYATSACKDRAYKQRTKLKRKALTAASWPREWFPHYPGEVAYALNGKSAVYNTILCMIIGGATRKDVCGVLAALSAARGSDSMTEFWATLADIPNFDDIPLPGATP